MVECVKLDLLCQGTENFTFQHSLWWFAHCCPQPSGTLLLFIQDWIKIWKMSVLLPAYLLSHVSLKCLGTDFGAVLVLGCQENPSSPVVWVVRLGMHSTAAAPEVNYCSLEIINSGLWCCQPHPGTRGAVLGFCAPALPVCAILCFLLLTNSSGLFAGLHFPSWNCNRNLNYDFRHLASFLLTGVLVVGNH